MCYTSVADTGRGYTCTGCGKIFFFGLEIGALQSEIPFIFVEIDTVPNLHENKGVGCPPRHFGVVQLGEIRPCGQPFLASASALNPRPRTPRFFAVSTVAPSDPMRKDGRPPKCSKAPPTLPRLPPLIPPFRHSLVEEGLYRGAHPSLKNMRFMRRLNLRTILSLVHDTAPPRDLFEYCNAERIRHVWHHVEKYDDSFSHTPQLVATVLSDLIDPRNHPLYIHCRDGGHNTGLVVMCLRRLQNWSLPSIYHEFTRYTKINDISYEEKQFVESFHAAVTVPAVIPRWLWNGIRHRRHPSIQLRLELDSTSSLQSPNPSVAKDLDSHAVPSFNQLPSLRDFDPDFRLSLLTPGGKPHCKRVQIRFRTRIAALDLHGVYLLKR